MALGSAGEIHALYAPYAPDPLVYAYHDGCTWSTQSIAGESGGIVGIALDAAGRPHIAYGKAGAAGEILVRAPGALTLIVGHGLPVSDYLYPCDGCRAGGKTDRAPPT